jgi:hypothetical protein
MAILTSDLFLGHNLCFKCSNGSCEPILDIFDPRALNPKSSDIKNSPIIGF